MPIENKSVYPTGGLDIIHEESVVAAQNNSQVIKMKDKLDLLLKKYQTVSLPDAVDKLDSMIKRIDRCRKEFDSTRFFILVVGPLKSGKSTFVNILANKKVSPTDTLECTVVPTIIGKTSGSALNKITKYTPSLVGTDVDPVRVFGSIIDVLRGIESPAILKTIVKDDSIDATDENITQIITGKTKEPGAPIPILATIGINGSDFVDDDIMIIDMPGLDGTKAGKEDLLYQEMVNRADFIFFVQSTTSAINEATSDFLVNILKGRLSSVPIHLIHNIHESMYFKSDDIIEAMIKEKVNNGVQCIRDKFNMPDLHFTNHVFNFAKISAGVFNHTDVKSEYSKMIDAETTEFRAKQTEMVTQLRSDRQIIKDTANITKTKKDLEQILTELNDLRDQITTQITQYNDSIAAVEEIIIDTDVSIVALMANINAEIINSNISNLWETAITGVVSGITPTEKRGIILKGEIDKLAKKFGEVNPMRQGTAFHNTLSNRIKDYIAKELDSTIKSAITKIEKHVDNATFNSVINISNLNITVSFVPDYLDIREYKRVFGVDIWREKTYDAPMVRHYLKDNSGYIGVATSQIPSRMTLYTSLLEVEIINVINKYTDSLITELTSYKDRIKVNYQAKIDALTSQLETVNSFINDIN